MKITFLGTSCMVPTKDRNVQGIHLSYRGESILIDCGEGTQRQMNLAGINRNGVSTILVTHWHGDHVGGIIGLLQTISDKDKPPRITIYGPVGSKKAVKHLLDSVIFESKNLDLKVVELDPKNVKVFKETNDYYLECAPMNHTTPCIAYSFKEKDVRKINMTKAKKMGLQEGPMMRDVQKGKVITVDGKKIKPEDISMLKKGRRVTFLFDTIPNKNAVDLAMDSDLLISEAVYLPDMEENAKKFKHLRTNDAGLIANKARVKKLIITHVSQRYKDAKVLEDDTKNYFSNTELAYDFMKVKL